MSGGLLVRVRILKTPNLRELDGVRLDNMMPGTVREVSASIGAWLIAEGFAQFEMRSPPREQETRGFSTAMSVTRERRRRPSPSPDPPPDPVSRRRKTD